jgi:Asp-tRNA(Asn)/Glu-tRNA(Gln) amidotransferase A subunit family amidase
MESLLNMSACQMAEMIRQRELSPVELVEAHLQRIDRLNPALNAIIHLDRDRALAAARIAEKAVAARSEVGVLHGVPLTIKSSIDVAGLPCEAGSRLMKDRVPAVDAPLVARLKAAGAVVLGNTNTPELLMAYETDNLLYGRTNNPWDLDRTPGGSSGGEAAAIAAGLSAGGVGSDGGGSIRIPAHFAGICGLKPTPGRVPATRHTPTSAGPFALIGVVGPMARTVADVRALFEVMAGYDAGDPSSAPVPVRRVARGEVRNLKIGFFDDDGRTPVTPETRGAVRRTAQALSDAGFAVEEFRPDGLARARELWWNIFGRAGQLILGPMFAGREQELSPILRQFVQYVSWGPPLTVEELMSTLLERDALRGGLLKQMEEYAVLLCPACSIPAFRHGERGWTVEGQGVNYLDAMSYTQWFNILGNPALVFPAGCSPEGLPIGVQIVGRPYQEEEILAVAEVAEQARGDLQPPATLDEALRIP